MDTTHRRSAVAIGIVCLLCLIPLAGGGLAQGASTSKTGSKSKCHRGTPPFIHDGFPEPKRIYSRGGRLNVKLRAGDGPTRINGKRVTGGQTYNGQFPGPTLMICRGDRVKVRFRNRLDEPTNLHTHGFHVSPSGNHDNVYLNLKPDSRFNYRYNIGKGQPAGNFWYHPHLHGYVEPQIFAGLSGAIIQEGGIDRLRALRDVPQRTMVIQSTEVIGNKVIPVEDTLEKDTPLHVNGWVNPRVRIRPGQIQRWRIFNANDNRITVLRLKGHKFRVLSKDGNALKRPHKVRDLYIGPGQRRDVLVRGRRAGKYVMRALPFAQFPGGDKAKNGGPTPNQHVITMRSKGRRAHDRFPSKLVRPREDLRKEKVQRRRTIIFDEEEVTPTEFDFTINGHTFDSDRVMTMKLDAVEEWKLVNRNTEWHTFHIHVNDFQVISVKGKRRRYIDYEDNVLMPPNSTVIIRQRPKDFTGKFVFHCHVTFHEDNGMMAAVQVVKNPNAVQRTADVTREGALTIASSAFGSDKRPDPNLAELTWADPGPRKGDPWGGAGPVQYCRLGSRGV